MGNTIFGQCETCCAKESKEYEQESFPILLKKSSRASQVYQNKKGKTIIISSSKNYIFTNSDTSDKLDLSMTLENTSIKTYKSEFLILIENLISNQIYEKMIKGERLHNILENLANYNNNMLFDLLISILKKINDIFNETTFEESAIISLHQNFIQMTRDLKAENIIDDIKLNIEEDSRLKYNLLDIIESCVELYHFFKYKIFKNEEPYNKFYWEQYKDCISYMEKKVSEIKNGINNINLSIGDNKIKIIE